MRNRGLGILGGFVLGAGTMYLFDSHRGRHRRAVVRDKALHVYRSTEKRVKQISRDMRNRVQGVVAKTKAAKNHRPVPDDVLLDRVRSKIGHLVSTAGAIQVNADMGRVTLVGSVPRNESSRLVELVSSIPGVTEVRNRLSMQDPSNSRSARQETAQSWMRPLLWGLAASALAAYRAKAGGQSQTKRALGS
jgi:hypothetical protein